MTPMKRMALVVQNMEREGPGAIAAVLRDRGIRYDVADVSRGMKLPASLDRYGCVFMMGGQESANDPAESMVERLELAKYAIGSGVPFLGICLGMQMAVRAHGGSVHKALTKEIGWRDPVSRSYFEIELTGQGRKDPLFSGLPDKLKVFHLHGETVRLASGMVLLATGSVCPNQVVKIGKNAYGVQGHMELTEEMFGTWLGSDPDLKGLSHKELEIDYRSVKDEYESNGHAMLSNFLDIAGL